MSFYKVLLEVVIHDEIADETPGDLKDAAKRYLMPMLESGVIGEEDITVTRVLEGEIAWRLPEETE